MSSYTKPQLLNVKKASSSILGAKQLFKQDSGTGSNSSVTAYRSDE
jgi:hypothetical protein